MSETEPMFHRRRTALILATVLHAISIACFAGQDFPAFTDVAAELGVTMVNVSGEGRSDYIIEVNGNGAAFFDYDNDGDVDLLLTNGTTLDRLENGGDPLVALYNNEDGKFTDVTSQARISQTGWAFGVCVADYDNDGYRDFYLTAYGPNRLYRNNGDGTFEERAGEAGVAQTGWGTNCAFGDYDRDGNVDLYVANYLTFDRDVIAPREEGACVYMGATVFCGPKGLDGEADVLYHNDGDGSFTDVTLDAGITDPGHYGFGVVFSDFDNDGWPDIYVANDSVANLLFVNDGDGTFTELGLISGTALSLSGREQAGMGIGIGDYDADGDFDIYVTNFAEDVNTLYQNVAEAFFVDVTEVSGAARSSRPYVGWGTGFVDLDNDGWLDLFVANGHVYPGMAELNEATPYLQPKEVYRNLGDGRFQNVVPDIEGDLLTPWSSRGAAFGDYDNDGDIDIVVVNFNAPPSIYRNDGGNLKSWIGFRLVGDTSNRDAIGARVEIDVGERTQIGEVRSGGSYLSHNDMRIHFGLGQASSVDEVRIRWPSGQTEVLTDVEANQFVTIKEGQGIVPG
jgi:hypothetical protein